MSYLVLEIHKSYCIVLDEEGRFLKAANLGYEIGQTLDSIIGMEEHTVKKFLPSKTITAIASLATCFVLVFAALLNAPLAIHGSVYLSINPEIRADVSKDGLVVALNPLNEDARTLIEGYESKKKPLSQAANDLVDRAIELGFLSSGGAIVIDIDSPDQIWFQETGLMLRQNLNAHIQEGLSITIEIKAYGAGGGNPQEDDPAITPPPASPAPKEPPANPAPAPQEPSRSKPQYITGDQALAAALKHAGISASQAREIEIEFEEDDGRKEYEISFRAGNMEYEYEIDAITAAILEAEKERDDDDDDD